MSGKNASQLTFLARNLKIIEEHFKIKIDVFTSFGEDDLYEDEGMDVEKWRIDYFEFLNAKLYIFKFLN